MAKAILGIAKPKVLQGLRLRKERTIAYFLRTNLK